MYVTQYVWTCSYTVYIHKVRHHCGAFFKATGWLWQLGSLMSYRVERLAASGPLRRVGDTLRSSASEPAGHPAGDAVPSVLLQHLRVRQKERSRVRAKGAFSKCLGNYSLEPTQWFSLALRVFIIYYHSLFATSFFLEASSRTGLDFT